MLQVLYKNTTTIRATRAATADATAGIRLWWRNEEKRKDRAENKGMNVQRRKAEKPQAAPEDEHVPKLRRELAIAQDPLRGAKDVET